MFENWDAIESNDNNTAEEKNEEDVGCGFCVDKRSHKNIELYFLDRASNMRVCSYCPSCGRKLTR